MVDYEEQTPPAVERQLIVGPESPEHPFPFYLEGRVVKGFGRGSKELGIPTANFPEHVACEKCKEYENGVYYGWVTVGDAQDNLIYPMVMSIGWNPYYKNEKRSAEVHVINEEKMADFYGEMMRVIVLGYIRPEKDYKSLDALIQDIHLDIKAAQMSLKRLAYSRFKNDQFFHQS